MKACMVTIATSMLPPCLGTPRQPTDATLIRPHSIWLVYYDNFSWPEGPIIVLFYSVTIYTELDTRS